MDYTDLREITQTIIKVIQNAVPAAVTVFPEMLPADGRPGIGFYLFHVQENAHYKNDPALSSDHPPVSFTPMALNLFYQLSANSRDNSSDEDALTEQELMSLSMKALHDHPRIRKTLPTPANLAGKDIDIKITLQNLSPSESVQYWAAAQSSVRLSAYYEVSVVFMRPETPKSYAGRVLTYGNFVFVTGAPQISATENTIEFPSPVDATLTQITAQPAQSPPASVTPAPPASIVSIRGTNFNAGTLRVFLINPLWPQPAVADAPWDVKLISENQIDITVRPTAILRDSLAAQTISPGVYTIQVGLTEQKILPNGSVKTFNHLSNQFPLCIAPRLDTITPGGGGRFTITGHLFQHADIKSGEVQIFLAQTILSETIAAGLPAPGEFKIIGATTIQLNAPGSVHGTQTPLRVMVKGIESGPNWINVP